EVTVEDQESSSSNSESSGAYLSLWDQGDAVAELQTKLQKAGYGLEVDGSYGPITKQKVEDLQRAQNLNVDGTFGNATSNALDALVASSNGNITQTEIVMEAVFKKTQTLLNQSKFLQVTTVEMRIVEML